jgi:hypothetical protein
LDSPGSAPYRTASVRPPPPPPRLIRARGRWIAPAYAAVFASNFVVRLCWYHAAWARLPAIWIALRWAGHVGGVLALTWVYLAWTSVPEAYRGTISPRRAAFSLLIPFYNAYWALVINSALCETLDAILERAGSPRRAPRFLATIAPCVWLMVIVVYAAIVVRGTTVATLGVFSELWTFAPIATSVLWIVYMVRCDAARDAVVRLAEGGGLRGAPRLSELQRTAGPGVLSIVGWCALVLLLLACWQILSPGERPPKHVDASATPG